MGKRTARKKPKAPKETPFSPAFLAAEAPAYYGAGQAPRLVFQDDEHGIWLYQGDSLLLLEQISAKYPEGLFDLIFADPPYFLSNGGITCHAGRMVSVNKGEWDKAPGPDEMHKFNTTWLAACQKALKRDGTIFVSGTSHVIHSVGFAMQQLGYKLLNDIIWVKPNPPPNLSCRYFTHSTETIIWAAKNKKSKHCFNYDLMRQMAGGKQMKSVWKDIRWDDGEVEALCKLLPCGRSRKAQGRRLRHKPIHLLQRLMLSGSREGALVFDPFLGSGSTAVAARMLNRRFVGCELDRQYLSIATKRLRSRRKPQQLRLC